MHFFDKPLDCDIIPENEQGKIHTNLDFGLSGGSYFLSWLLHWQKKFSESRFSPGFKCHFNSEC
jgi:hypothetical protein